MTTKEQTWAWYKKKWGSAEKKYGKKYKIWKKAIAFKTGCVYKAYVIFCIKFKQFPFDSYINVKGNDEK